MATGKRFYWMKLKESFMTSDTIDYFMSQPNGAQYVVLYQMLCLKTINTDGKLERKIGEVIIPYDISKIQRDTKWFSEDTIRVALQLYKSFGLIYEDQNGTLVMTDHSNLVGSETDYAIQKKNQRFGNPNQKKLSSGSVDSAEDTAVDNVHTDIRDKRIDIRDRDKEKEQEERPVGGVADMAAEFHRIQQDHNEVINAAEAAGFPKNQATWDKIIALYADYGKEAVLAGISACVDQGKTAVSYLKACVKGIAEEKPKAEPDEPYMDDNHEFWGWGQ